MEKRVHERMHPFAKYIYQIIRTREIANTTKREGDET